MAVEWDAISEDQITQTGTFSVAGKTAAGDTVSVTVNMIDQVAASAQLHHHCSGRNRAGASGVQAGSASEW